MRVSTTVRAALFTCLAMALIAAIPAWSRSHRAPNPYSHSFSLGSPVIWRTIASGGAKDPTGIGSHLSGYMVALG